MPDEAFASYLCFHVVCTIVDGQLQGVDAGATSSIGVSIRVSARRGVGRVMPDKALANSFCFDIVRAVVNRQFQGVDAGATGSVCVRMCVST